MIVEQSSQALLPTPLKDAFTRPQRRSPSFEQQARLNQGDYFEHPYAGGHLAAWRFGDGTPVLLVHGWDACAADMLTLLDPLRAAGHSVVVFDNPAHGRSSGERTSVLDIGEAVYSLAGALGEVRALVAHSVGSAASLWAFQRGLRVQNSVHFAGPSSLSAMLSLTARAFGLPPMVESALLDWGAELIGRPLADLDVENLYGALRHPGLIIHDPRDRVVPFAASQALHAYWPDSRLIAAEGLGHNRVLGDAQLIEQVLDFIGTASA